MNYRIRPLTGQVLVEVLPTDTHSAGGIEFPQHTQSPEEVQASHRRPEPPPPLTGIVREIGPWPKLKNGMAVLPDFGIGARVIVRHNAGIQMQRNIGERFRMVLVEEVLAVVN